ncbi:conserved Plasmodium protein, unknown function [Plasmodium berghei]|uniref:Fam-c protein n=2 Tax=Plasmodium berghei TaxID=5821 RepID=A0A509ALC6_PLABA|nr:conserved Plasmodium protein, unknown function [Plasmodium berghei ANKA]CXI56627.1 conserved Plasmodium protein, unknown function [Plasmodium berghei]SCL95400.1 conserved Plasmodium protein, unknown function [Plasmodium berghei]SCM16248.1 conserved Plasmodium protein, unknown function [Plasmodium berghei]SCM18044.1 conserved Plasmodium protein, unknown function [Plasmodium berghei]SCN26482.1 conserved Plasmodium protein, unknown function [Plasmodium berghei]|eukprot:XP_034422172.1 conserved Plasmodium protein, unknown function [Plasmodium berghei ANKA]
MVNKKVITFSLFLLLNLSIIKCNNGETESNILKNMNIDSSQEAIHMEHLQKLKELLNENKLAEATELFNEMKTVLDNHEHSENYNNKIIDENNFFPGINEHIFDNLINPNDIKEMIRFYMYLQNVLNSKNETSEKKMVKKFLRKTMEKVKNNNENKTIDEIINDIEGHDEMLEKLASLMKLSKNELKDPEIKNKLNQILIGMIKFREYTNDSSVTEALLNDIQIQEVPSEDGSKKPKLQVNISNSKAHLDILHKATKFMGMEIDHEELKNLTINNKWYENFLTNIINSSDEL